MRSLWIHRSTLKWGLSLLVCCSWLACSAPKSGCPAEESRARAIKANKKTKKQSKTELFPREMKKKMSKK